MSTVVTRLLCPSSQGQALEVRELVTSTLPGWMAEDLHIRARPSAMELAGGRVRPPGPCAWCELLDQPFEVPSTVAADLGSPLGGTMFGLEESDRAALSAVPRVELGRGERWTCRGSPPHVRAGLRDAVRVRGVRLPTMAEWEHAASGG